MISITMVHIVEQNLVLLFRFRLNLNGKLSIDCHFLQIHHSNKRPIFTLPHSDMLQIESLKIIQKKAHTFVHVHIYTHTQEHSHYILSFL